MAVTYAVDELLVSPVWVEKKFLLLDRRIRNYTRPAAIHTAAVDHSGLRNSIGWLACLGCTARLKYYRLVIRIGRRRSSLTFMFLPASRNSLTRIPEVSPNALLLHSTLSPSADETFHLSRIHSWSRRDLRCLPPAGGPLLTLH